MKLIQLAKMIHQKAKRMRESGEAQTFIPLEGQLALMLDKIKRYYKTNDPDEILGLAADALFALGAVTGNIEEEPEPEPPPQDTGILPQEFIGWSQDPEKARGLREYIIAAGYWSGMPEEDKKKLNDVAGLHEDAEPSATQ